MESFHENMNEYRKQLEKGAIQKAYKGLMVYLMNLRTYFDNKYPDHFVSSSIYYGYMDMTYFAFTPKSLTDRKLKIAIVFSHERFRFEAWLAGANRRVQKETWKFFKESNWEKYRIVPTTKGVDWIVEHIITEHPDFSNLDALTQQIESESLKFIADVESFLTKNKN